MIVIVGSLVVLGAVLAGFIGSGGHVGALIHPFELVTIGGCAIGAMIIMSPRKVLVDLFRGMVQSLKGSPYNKRAYTELFQVMYDLLRAARREGLMILESHVSDPHHSEIFRKYPGIMKNHHVTEFICGGLSPIIEGIAKPEQMPALLDAEIKVIEEEHHAPVGVLSKTADALPGFGIVAAVLGIVITMGAIDGPVEEIGHKVGAALVGTFLGILMSYGFIGPLVGRMEFLGSAELAYYRTTANVIIAFVNDVPPKVAIEQARRSVGTEMRPSRKELDEMFKQVDALAT
ncbi:MAG: flagellar motor stator protein MotA [Planctomycetota bacterium]|nr:flagellar motor stator protein MotA [Planctomycetota bacterium]